MAVAGLTLLLIYLGATVFATSSPQIKLSVTTTTISATDDHDDTTNPTTWHYLVLDNGPCDVNTDFSSATSYAPEGNHIPLVDADHSGKYFCFRSTDGSSNNGYLLSGAIGGYPTITSITINQHKIDFNRIIVTTVSFSEDIIHDLGPNNDKLQNLSLRFNSQRSDHQVTRLKQVSGNQVIFEYRPQHGDYTPGIETATTSDDEYFDVTEIILGDDSLSDSDGNPAILAIPDAVNISATRQLKVDLRVPTITVTNPTDLTTVAATRTFRAVDDWTGNDGLTNNGYSDFWQVYVFEYYFVPAALVDNQTEADHNCRINGFFQEFSEDQRFSYQEGTDVVVTEDYNNHHICFRSRRPGDEFVGGRDSFGFVGVVSALIQNLQTPKPAVSVTVGSVTNSFKATDDYTLATDWVYQLINATTDTCDKSLNWTEATSYSEGTDIAYTAANNGQRVCFRAQDTASNGYGYGVSDEVYIDNVAPTLVTITATDGVYGPSETITLTVTFSEAVSFVGNARPQLSLTTSPLANADFTAHPSPTTMTFSYTVSPDDGSIAQLDVNSFELNGSTIEDGANNALETDIPSGGHLSETAAVAIDVVAPEITVTEPDARNQVSATATDDLDDAPVFEFKLIDHQQDCQQETDDFRAYTAGTRVALAYQAKACFRASDHADHVQLTASLAGKDLPANIVTPVVTVRLDQVNKTISATDDQANLITSWLYRLSLTCNSSTDFSDGLSYDEGQALALNLSHQDQRFCFAASDTAGNRGYGLSELITAEMLAPASDDQPPAEPSQPQTSEISDLSDDDDGAVSIQAVIALLLLLAVIVAIIRSRRRANQAN